jgi:hypothetical protein
MPPPPIRVTLPYDPAGDLEAFIFAQLGVVPMVEDRRRGLDDLPGYVVLATALSPFLKGVLDKLGGEAAEALARAVRRLGRPNGQAAKAYEVRLVDPGSRVTVVIEPGTAADPRAFEALAALQEELPTSGTVLRWDAASASWRRAGPSATP